MGSARSAVEAIRNTCSGMPCACRTNSSLVMTGEPLEPDLAINGTHAVGVSEKLADRRVSAVLPRCSS